MMGLYFRFNSNRYERKKKRKRKDESFLRHRGERGKKFMLDELFASKNERSYLQHMSIKRRKQTHQLILMIKKKIQ